MILFEQASFVFLVSSRFKHLEISQTHSKAPSIHPPSFLSQECHLKTIKELDSLFLYLKNIYEIAMLERKKKKSVDFNEHCVRSVVNCQMD